MIEQIHRFLNELDAELAKVSKPGERLDLYHLGRSVLILRFALQGLATKDFDIVWMRESPLEDLALESFGKGKPRSEELGMYLDPVAQDLPPLPGRFKSRSVAWTVPGRSCACGSLNRTIWRRRSTRAFVRKIAKTCNSCAMPAC